MPLIRIALDGQRSVAALLTEAPDPFAFLVLAHGAGAGIRHPFLQGMAEALARHGVSVLRYQFPYIEAGSKRPDPPAVAQGAVRSAVSAGAEHAGALPLFAGGKSFGGRMTSQAEAADPLPVRGLVFLGFPLHPAGKPSMGRAEHLDHVQIPMLLLQGSRDAMADLGLIEAVVGRLGALATMHIMPDADHSFRVPARNGRRDAEVVEDLAQQTALWMREVSKVGARSR
jgi:predicted alpha/beta-hydrolase family hydrolase